MSESDPALQAEIDGLKLAFDILATCLFRHIPTLREECHEEIFLLNKNAHTAGEEGPKYVEMRLRARELFISKLPRS